jgi:hypothetical protein
MVLAAAVGRRTAERTQLEQEIRAKKGGNHPFLPNATAVVSSHIGTREDFVSYTGNDFSIFHSLSSINPLPHQRSA